MLVRGAARQADRPGGSDRSVSTIAAQFGEIACDNVAAYPSEVQAAGSADAGFSTGHDQGASRYAMRPQPASVRAAIRSRKSVSQAFLPDRPGRESAGAAAPTPMVDVASLLDKLRCHRRPSALGANVSKIRWLRE
jgi:hypothetical protein